MVEVVESDINLRAGPGTNFPIIGSAARGARYPVTGQASDCGWLQIRQENGEPAWITGAPVYTQLNVACSRVPAAQVPTATPAPTVAPMPTATRPAPAAATATQPPPAPPAPAAGGPNSIAPLSPPSGAEVGGSVAFAWTPDAPLGPGQVFELVFWNVGQGPNDGRALAGASAATSVQINVDSLAPGPHPWGIFLAQASPYQRIRFLGQGGTINVTGGGSDDSSGSGGGGDPSSPPEPGGKD